MEDAQETNMDSNEDVNVAQPEAANRPEKQPQSADEGAESKDVVTNGAPSATTPNKSAAARVNKTVQPNFDFDYDGPPVIVSNGMALELVNRFGLNNAWGAFLKLKGYHTPYDKSAPQPPEHVQALKRFRRKIRGVREMFNALRDKNEDTIPLMSREFVVLLKGAGESAELDETPKPNGKETKAEDNASDHADKTPDPASTANGAVPADPTHPKRPRKSARKDTKKDQSTAAADNRQPASTLNKIDEIVTNVIDRVMSSSQSSQQPSTSQHAAGSTATSTSLADPSASKRKLPPKQSESMEIPPNALQMQSTLLDLNNVEQLQELYRQNPGLLGQLGPTSLPLHSMQSLLKPTSSALVNTAPIPTTLTLGTSNVARYLLQQQHPHPPAFVDPSTAQLLLPPTPQPTPAMASFATPFPLLGGTAGVFRALQQQQQVSNFATAAHLAQSSAAWPLTTFDSSLASAIPSQSSTQPPKTADNKPLTIEIVDETKPEVEKPTKQKPPKERPFNDRLSTDSKQSRKPSKSASTSGSISGKALASPQPSTPKDKKTPPKKQKELEESLSEAREQIEQLESQLNAERTKFSVQKRRMDMMRDKLKKKDDELQTARIDYACQKTDNGVLRQRVETLKTENDELRKRLGEPTGPDFEEPSTSTASVLAASTPTASAAPPAAPSTNRRRRGRDVRAQASGSDQTEETEDPQPPPAAPAPRKRRKVASTPAASTTKTESDSDAEEPENERRKSKRLRTRLLYN